MKELIVHAGMPKNGSSAIQVMFAKHRDMLLRMSVDYFKMGEFNAGVNGEITSGNGALLSRVFLDPGHEAHLGDPEDKHMNILINNIKASDCEIGIISSEFFSNIPLASIEKILNHCQKLGVKLKYFYYVRRQDQFLMSGYIQRVKRHQYTEYPENFIKKTYKSVGFLKYFSFTESIASIIGKENVIVRHFDKCKKHQKGLAADFLETLGCDISDLDIPNVIVNISPSPIEIKALLTLNKFKPRRSLTDGIVKDSADFMRNNIFADHSILNPELCQEVLNYFADQNKRLQEKYFDSSHKFNFEVSQDFVNLRTLEFSTMDLLDIIGSILVRLERGIK